MPWLANYGTYGSFRGIAEFLVKMQSFDAPYTFVTAKVDELRTPLWKGTQDWFEIPAKIPVAYEFLG